MYKSVKEFLREVPEMYRPCYGEGVQKLRPGVKCADGFEISIQASADHYCTPRENGLVDYTHVELGFPNRKDELIFEYAEIPGEYTDGIYPYVPIEVVEELIAKHGGFAE